MDGLSSHTHTLFALFFSLPCWQLFHAAAAASLLDSTWSQAVPQIPAVLGGPRDKHLCLLNVGTAVIWG